MIDSSSANDEHRVYATLGVGIGLLLCVFAMQYGYNNARLKRPETPGSFLPAAALRNLDLGLHSAFASLVWLKLNNDVYTWLSPDYRRINSDVKIISELDPKWGYPYAFAAIMAQNEKEAREAMILGEHGIALADPDWKLPYFLAMDYHTYLKDRLNAARYFDLAAQTPGAPENTKHVAAVYGTGKDSREEMKEIWRVIAENSKDELLRERAEKFIAFIEYLDIIEPAKAEYKKRTGKEPSSLEELLKSGILKAIPPNPLEQ